VCRLGSYPKVRGGTEAEFNEVPRGAEEISQEGTGNGKTWITLGRFTTTVRVRWTDALARKKAQLAALVNQDDEKGSAVPTLLDLEDRLL